MGREVIVLPTGVANVASVLAAFRRLGASPRLADEPEALGAAERVVLPGVGTFGAAMLGLRRGGFDQVIAARVRERSPTLAMCVGLQLLFEESDESPEAQGLGVIEGRVGRFPETVRTPQFGWNRIEPEPGCRYLEPGHAYFANSYRTLAAPGCQVAHAEHGHRFVAGLELGDVLACQFHPELSGAYGRDLMARWLEG
jgi:glutamine amidotransferase